jgi:hypothetical protein
MDFATVAVDDGSVKAILPCTCISHVRSHFLCYDHIALPLQSGSSHAASVTHEIGLALQIIHKTAGRPRAHGLRASFAYRTQECLHSAATQLSKRATHQVGQTYTSHRVRDPNAGYQPYLNAAVRYSWNHGSFRTHTRDVRTHGATAPHLRCTASGSG